jgi:hypothetical protein
MLSTRHAKTKPRRNTSATTKLQSINKAMSQLRQAVKLISGQEMEAEYIMTAMTQIAVAFKNLEDYRCHILDAIPSAENDLLRLAKQVLPKQPYSICARPLPGPVEPIVNVSSERTGGKQCHF